MAVNVSACLVTRGDVDMQPVIDSIPQGWEIVIWDNGEGRVTRSDGYAEVAYDLGVFGRYAAIEHATHDLVYVQDDDVIVSDPLRLADRWVEEAEATAGGLLPSYIDHVVCNMPPEFRHDFYQRHALVGFGGCFDRSHAQDTFERFIADVPVKMSFFNRCCDIVLTGLSRRLLVNVEKENREMASDDNRMWKQPEHQGERQQMLDLVVPLRDQIMAEEAAALRGRLH